MRFMTIAALECGRFSGRYAALRDSLRRKEGVFCLLSRDYTSGKWATAISFRPQFVSGNGLRAAAMQVQMIFIASKGFEAAEETSRL